MDFNADAFATGPCSLSDNDVDFSVNAPAIRRGSHGDTALQPSPPALSRCIEDIADYMRRLATQARGRRATMPYAICYDWLTLLLSNIDVCLRPPKPGGGIHTTCHMYNHLLISPNTTSSAATHHALPHRSALRTQLDSVNVINNTP
ncbi:hypothetical protein CYMTET_34533 [Cymbomonas tetramitiformis]|uniref:Uncharacterized protein n=1 Tax=Cymbomonas tetramitiformis TaxID=36881 RepID=A0AAE0KQ43_9CHLO|nr:hypothetical protein CYMTET_34533 [Cymbomonas tetramitiformis]